MDGRASSQTITDKLPYFIESGINLYVLSAITGKKMTDFFINKLLVGGHQHLDLTFDIGLLIVLKRGFLYKIITPTNIYNFSSSNFN